MKVTFIVRRGVQYGVMAMCVIVVAWELRQRSLHQHQQLESRRRDELSTTSSCQFVSYLICQCFTLLQLSTVQRRWLLHFHCGTKFALRFKEVKLCLRTTVVEALISRCRTEATNRLLFKNASLQSTEKNHRLGLGCVYWEMQSIRGFTTTRYINRLFTYLLFANRPVGLCSVLAHYKRLKTFLVCKRYGDM